VTSFPLLYWLESHASASTREAYATDLRQFLGRDPQFAAPKELARIGPKEVLDYARRLHRRFKPATVARKLATLRSAFGHLAQTGVTKSNPALAATPPVVPPVATTQGLTESSAARLLDGPRRSVIAKRDHAILLLLLHNGLRRSEIASLRSRDVKAEVDGSTIALIRRGRQVRAVKVKPEIVDAIREYHAASAAGEFVFRSHSHRVAGTGLTPKAVWLVVKSAAKRAGLEKRISPNSLRLTHITMALARGCPLGRVQAAVGHARPESTMRYGRLVDAEEHATDFVSFRRKK